MSTERLPAIRARAEAASAGPWTVDRNTPFSVEIVGIFSTADDAYIVQQDVSGDDETAEEGMTEPDAVFIANARGDIPWLLQQIERRDAVLDRIAEANNWTAVQAILDEYVTSNEATR